MSKVIGILGGMGSYATVEIFRRVIDAFPAEKEWDRPRILIDNNCIMPSRVRAILYEEKREELIEAMTESINQLVRCGEEQIILGCVTAHCFFDRLPHQDIIVSMITETAKAVPEGTITVLCTEGTKAIGIWEKALTRNKIIYPNDEQMSELREFIEIVKQGKITSEKQMKFQKYVNSFWGENILLGCTELPILYGDLIGEKHIIDPIGCTIEKLKIMNNED